jgi:DNA-binding transcriptional LysR family regulator
MVNLEWYRSFIESTLGMLLFQRLPRRMLPTEDGKRLYTRVATAIEALESIPTKANLGDTPLHIRLGTPIEFFSEYVLERLPKENTVLFTIQFGLVQDLVEKLLDNQIDCAITRLCHFPRARSVPLREF